MRLILQFSFDAGGQNFRQRELLEAKGYNMWLGTKMAGKRKKWRGKNGGKKKAAGVRHETFDTLKFKFPVASPDWLS